MAVHPPGSDHKGLRTIGVDLASGEREDGRGQHGEDLAVLQIQ